MSKIIKITGAATGIGKATTLAFIAQGHHVVASGRTLSRLETLKEEAEKLSGKVTIFQEDVTNLDMVKDVYARTLSDIGTPDIVWLNAGQSEHAPVSQFDPALYHRLYETNQMGIINGLAPAIEDMKHRQSGHIAITASVAGYRGMPTATAYCMTKAALINLAEGLRPELLNYNVGLQLVCPGFVRTPMTDKNKFPMPFLTEPEEIASYLVKHLGTDRFEIIYPRFFGYIMRFYRLLPNWCIEKAGKIMISQKKG